MRLRQHSLTVLLLCASGAAAAPLRAQCPDGAPPPCRVAAPRATLYDSSTALVFPLTPVGAEPALRALGASLSAVMAENLNAGELHAVAMDDAGATAAARRALAVRRRAGAVVDGSVLRLGPVVRATVRLTRAATGEQLATTSVEGPADSIIRLADRAALSVLRAWWRVQPGDVTREGLTTPSLAAARAYIAAMQARRLGQAGWRATMDSVVRYDSTLAAAWMWLATPTYERNIQLELLSMGMSSSLRQRGDSALQRLQALRTPADIGLMVPQLFAAVAAGVVPVPTPRAPDPLGTLLIALRPGAGAEANYIVAIAAAVARLAGLPESVAVRTARGAASARPPFMPGSRLLFNVLADEGDTSGARAVLNEAYPPEGRAQARALLAWRWADTLAGVDPQADSTPDPTVLLQWHRFRPLRGLVPLMRRVLAGAGAGAGGADAVMASFAVPGFVAMGQVDSVTVAVRGFEAVAAGSGDALNRILSTTLPPDSLYVARAAPGAGDSLLAQFRVAHVRLDSMAGSSPTLAPTLRTMLLGGHARLAWHGGVVALQRGQAVTAYQAVLDSVAALDSTALPLAYGLRAESALRHGDGAAAESLMVKALSTSIHGCPARYRWLLAQRYAATGQEELALRMAGTITLPSRQQGVDHLYYYADALLLEAELLERLHRPREATARYREFVELRKDADAVFQPQVAGARARLARLGP